MDDLRIGLIGDMELAREINMEVYPHFEVDDLPDADIFLHALPYRDVIVVDLAHPRYFREVVEELKRRNMLVLVLTDGNGDMKSVDFGGLTCRFLQKPMTLAKWNASLDPNAPLTLVLPDAGTVMTGKANDMSKPLQAKLAKKKAGRPPKKVLAKKAAR